MKAILKCREKPHSHKRQRLRLRQIANIASMGCVKRKEEWV